MRGWFAETLSHGLMQLANQMHFSNILIEVS